MRCWLLVRVIYGTETGRLTLVASPVIIEGQAETLTPSFTVQRQNGYAAQQIAARDMVIPAVKGRVMNRRK